MISTGVNNKRRQVFTLAFIIRNLCTNCRTNQIRGARRAETGAYPTTHKWSGLQVVNEDFEHRATKKLLRAGVCAKVSINYSAAIRCPCR